MNTWLATVYDPKVFFEVVCKEPTEASVSMEQPPYEPSLRVVYRMDVLVGVRHRYRFGRDHHLDRVRPQLWHAPTKGEIVLLAGIVTAAALVLNLISIRATAVVNNVGVSFELAGSRVAAAILLVGALFFFHHSEGVHALVQSGPVGGGTINLTAVGLAALLPVFVLLGWEGAADLAEETKDPRGSTPYAMLRANWASIGTSIVMIVCFAIAIPRGIPAMINQPENPLFYIFSVQVGAVAVAMLKAVVFLAMFSALLANMAVGTRMTFSLGRDGMLPASRALAWSTHVRRLQWSRLCSWRSSRSR